jgi:hypothetical protein
MGGILMCVGLRNPSMESNRNPRHDITGLMDNFIVWDLPRVRWILNFTSYLLARIL